ncbi:MAG: acyl carrier protein [Clostridia bacterium]|nr:acyl carrier protein [Clostridia bacterium]
MENQIKEIIAQELGISPDDINNDSDITEELGADSLDVVELIITFEDLYNIEIPDEDAVELRTVQKIINYLETRTQQ